MTAQDYLKAAMRTASPMIDRFGDRTINETMKHLRLANGGLGLVDEAIEAYEVLFDGELEDYRPKLHAELGDVFWYTAHICDTLAIEWNLVQPFGGTNSVPYRHVHQNMARQLLSTVMVVGELIKKHSYHGHAYDSQKFTEALLRVLVELHRLCYATGTTPEEVMAGNINKLRLRYPAKFEVEQSVNRAV